MADASGPVIVLVRHGQTEWSRDGRHTGRTDLPLTGYGEQQAGALAAALRGMSFAVVLTSPRTRARRTAELAGFASAEVSDDLAEWDYGDYEGRRSVEIRAENAGWYLWDDGVPGGESLDDIAHRIDRVLARLRPSLERGENACVFGHGHALRILTARWLGLAATGGRYFALDPATISLLGTEHARPAVRRWNQPVV